MAVLAALALATSVVEPPPLGPLVDLSGHRLHVHCTGKGRPTVVVENGFYEFSFDWMLVQSRVSAFTRICTYDRAGYAWSDPGPLPRTFDQITLELRDALGRVGEDGELVLVGHSFGGPVVRHYAAIHPGEVAGVLLVDSAQEERRGPPRSSSRRWTGCRPRSSGSISGRRHSPRSRTRKRASASGRPSTSRGGPRRRRRDRWARSPSSSSPGRRAATATTSTSPPRSSRQSARSSNRSWCVSRETADR